MKVNRKYILSVIGDIITVALCFLAMAVFISIVSGCAGNSSTYYNKVPVYAGENNDVFMGFATEKIKNKNTAFAAKLKANASTKFNGTGDGFFTYDAGASGEFDSTDAARGLFQLLEVVAPLIAPALAATKGPSGQTEEIKDQNGKSLAEYFENFGRQLKDLNISNLDLQDRLEGLENGKGSVEERENADFEREMEEGEG